IRSLMGTNVVLNNVTAVDLTNTTPATAVSTGAALTGTGAGQSEPSLSVMVNFVIAARYRGGHPRTYFPPPGSGQETATVDQWSTSYVNSFNTAMSTSFAQIVGSVPGTVHVVPLFSYTYTDDPTHHTYRRTRNAFTGSYTVASYVTSATIRHQRRRMTAPS